MSVKDLERRIVALEQEVDQLKSEVRATTPPSTKEWLAAIERFAGDEGLLSTLAGARKLREADRKRAKHKQAPQRKTRS
jgi:hypothetical protein